MQMCKRGHPKTEENIKRDKNGYIKDCIPCVRIRSLEAYYRNPEKHKKAQKEYYLNNRESQLKKARDNELKKKYGLTREEYDRMLKACNHTCMVKGCGSKKNLNIDHDHKTGRIRGILCNSCNRALGLLSDSAEKLKGLMDYLD
ncbi:hypothetical protein BH09PAT1_BH09PAT1_2710 [soil metagenome]